MATNLKKLGNTITLVAPTGGVASGAGLLNDELFGVATKTVLVGESVECQTRGVWSLAKTSAQAWVKGRPVYWDDTNKRCDSDAAVGPQIGNAHAAAANPSSTGEVRLLGNVKRRLGVSENEAALTAINTAGAVTLTVAQLLTGLIVVDCAGAGRTYTLPTAALMVAGIPNAKVGDMIRCYIVNGSDGAESITLAAGVGGDFDAIQIAASRIIPQNSSKMVHIRLTNVTAASEAYVVAA